MNWIILTNYFQVDKGVYHLSEHFQWRRRIICGERTSQLSHLTIDFDGVYEHKAAKICCPHNKYFRHQKIHSDSSVASSKNQHTFHRFLVSHANQEFPLPTPDRYNKLQYPPGALQQYRME
jgi:hypothetical protein